jgi:hypothetical protein
LKEEGGANDDKGKIEPVTKKVFHEPMDINIFRTAFSSITYYAATIARICMDRPHMLGKGDNHFMCTKANSADAEPANSSRKERGNICYYHRS